MPSLFSRLKGNNGPRVKKNAPQTQEADLPSPKPRWDDAWTRTAVEPEEVQELLRGCTVEIKSRALDVPFLLLPFRPTSDPSAARTFIRNFFNAEFDRGEALRGEALEQELRLSEPMVLCSVLKWCWSRLSGGVVTWEAYELFRLGEQDSNMARDSFATFIPLSLDSDSRTKIVFDFFDLLSAIAAHGKNNGLGGRKLSRLAGWWAFEHVDTGAGFDGGYKGWSACADATSHLFFAYLRSLSPDSVRGLNGISTLPMSLQKLVQETEYPPQRPAFMQTRTQKVVMIVESVSSTPFALLRRANHFQYRDEDHALQEFAEYEDPVKALTDECRRVLKSISNTNQSQVSNTKESTGLRDASWSRFEDIGFSGAFDEEEEDDTESNFLQKKKPMPLRTTPMSAGTMNMGRPTTPSWADFLSAGFVDEKKNGPAPLLLPPDKILPPIETSRGKSSQSHRPRLESNSNLEPGELASITRFDLDDAFWWVWISSLAGEEPADRKAAFGRCALIETIIPTGKWLVMEEMVKGAAPEHEEGAYIAEKKSRFGFSRRNKSKAQLERSKSMGKTDTNEEKHPQYKTAQSMGGSKASIGPDQHARIQAAAAQLQMRQRQLELQQKQGVAAPAAPAPSNGSARRGRDFESATQKTASVFTLQPVIMSEASPAMKWANKYDKDAIREAYLKNSATGQGRELGDNVMQSNGHNASRQSLERNPASYQSSRGGATPIPGQGPAVPSKSANPTSASMPPTPAADDADKQLATPENAAAVPHPTETKIERKAVGFTHDTEPPRSMSTEPLDLHKIQTNASTKSKQNKLKKGGGGGGFRNLFGRSKSRARRNSKLPDGVEIISNEQDGVLQPGGATIGRRFSGFGANSPVQNNSDDERHPALRSSSREHSNGSTPMRTPQAELPEHNYDNSVHESASRVDSTDAHEANQEFSRFDQGPLEDQPAYVGEYEADSEDERRGRQQTPEEVSPTEPVSPVQDRWAQIRKNAAERAAARQSEEQSRGGYSARTGEDDGETSGEETIESRVARIKARVAELTGNMESNNSSPASRSPARRA